MEITFTAGSTTTITSWSVDGSAGNYVTLQSSVLGSPFYLVASGGPFTSNYAIISDSNASADAGWTAGANSADWGGNTAWFDTASPACTTRIFFTPGETYNLTAWSVDGAPGANILLTSNPPSAAHFLVAASGGPFTSDYLNILWSEASPDADWTALGNCFDAGSNVGWFTYENTFGVVLWLEAWAPTAGVTTDSPSATVALEVAAATASVTADTAATDLWFEAGFNGEVPNVFSVIVWIEAWTASTETRADTYAADAAVEAQGVTAGVTTDSGGAEVAVTLQSPSTSVSGDAGGAGAVVEAGGAAGSAQGYAQAAVVDVGGVGVGAGVFAPASGAIIALEAAHRVWQHFARPPVVHQTIPRSMGERVISRVTLQATIAYPRLEMGVSRWRT